MSRTPDPARAKSTAEPGIILIQIDGLPLFSRNRKLIRTVRKTGGGKPAGGEQIVVPTLGPLDNIYLPSRPGPWAVAQSSHRRWRPATLRTAVLDFLNRSGDEDG